MVREYTVWEPELAVQNTLGEGPVWDARKQRLHWVDIDQRKVYTYEPSSGRYGYERFAGKMSSLALRQSEPGLISTSEHAFEIIPEESLPFPPTNSDEVQRSINISPHLKLPTGTNRFNDGFCDPAGRFLAGTMGYEIGTADGVLYRLDSTVRSKDLSGQAIYDPVPLIQPTTCTNGSGWTRAGTKMYFTDSWIKKIFVYDYELSNAGLSNRQVFSHLDDEEHGWPDGLCMDDQDGVWSARWDASKVYRFDSNGNIDVIIHFPKALNMTCVVWGGPNMDDLYVTSASNSVTGKHPIEKHPQGGDLFVVKNLGFKGVEKHRFDG